jgi:hypothetical protein
MTGLFEMCCRRFARGCLCLLAIALHPACGENESDGAIEERAPTVDGAHRGYRDARWADGEGEGDGGAGNGDDPPNVVPPGGDYGYLRRPVPILQFTVGKEIQREVEVRGKLVVIEDHDGTHTGLAARPAALTSDVGIEGRGRSSWDYAQKPYGFEIQDAAGMSRAVALLGLPVESDFVLHSCYADKTCMRNALTYALGRDLGRAAGRWAPRTRYVEVFIDGTYKGLYLLVERIKRDKQRLNIQKPAGDPALGDVTGGYIFSQEGNEPRPMRTWPSVMSSNHNWHHREPRGEEITPAQRKYLMDSVAEFERLLMRDKLGEETLGKIDVDSFVDYVIVQELSNNIDAFWKSWFFYKHPEAAGGRFVMGPVWDHDLAYGNAAYAKGHCASVLVAPGSRTPFRQLFTSPEFQDRMRCRWHRLRQPGSVLDIAMLEERVLSFQGHVQNAKERDRVAWMNIGKWIWPNNYVGTTFIDEVLYLRYWLRKRLTWLDENLPGVCTEVPKPPAVASSAAPVPAMETVPRGMGNPTSTMQTHAPSYVVIEGDVPPALTAWACPK